MTLAALTTLTEGNSKRPCVQTFHHREVNGGFRFKFAATKPDMKVQYVTIWVVNLS